MALKSVLIFCWLHKQSVHKNRTHKHAFYRSTVQLQKGIGGCASGSGFRLCFCFPVGLTVQKKLIFIHRTDSHNPRMKAEVASYILPTHLEMNLWLQRNLQSTQPTSQITIDEWHFLKIHFTICGSTSGLLEWVSNENLHPTITLLNFLSGNVLLSRQECREDKLYLEFVQCY